MLREHFIIVSDDGTFLADIRECSAEDGAHLSKKMAELVQNDAKIINGNLILLF